jgi:hypothetical protein
MVLLVFGHFDDAISGAGANTFIFPKMPGVSNWTGEEFRL